MNYKLLTIILSLILVVEIIIIFNQDQQGVCPAGTNSITMYSDLENYGVRVYYHSCVPVGSGTSSSTLVKICDYESENNCRKPYKQEVEENKFIPQSQVE